VGGRTSAHLTSDEPERGTAPGGIAAVAQVLKDRLVRLDELRELATRKLPPPVSEYFNQGASAEIATSAAVAAWDRIRLRPRILRDVSAIGTAAAVLGHEVATPVLIAPTTLQKAAHPEGEVAVARAAAAAGSLTVVSSNSGSNFGDIAATGATWWLQAYVLRDRGLTTAVLQRGREAGASAIVLTADTPVVGSKVNAGRPVWDVVPEDVLRVNLDVGTLPASALDKADDLTPDAIDWLRAVTGLPVVVKGVLRGDDARTVTAAGAAAVYVSNHGGRQLDQAVATADALPEVVAALAGTGAEIYVDGGVRRAEHVLAALALGANAVFLGRPVLWALAAGGAATSLGQAGQGGSDGVQALLTKLTDDLVHVMKLAGARNLAELTPDLVC
jgi:4-hydroxymandelate oxidase